MCGASTHPANPSQTCALNGRRAGRHAPRSLRTVSWSAGWGKHREYTGVGPATCWQSSWRHSRLKIATGTQRAWQTHGHDIAHLLPGRSRRLLQTAWELTSALQRWPTFAELDRRLNGQPRHRPHSAQQSTPKPATLDGSAFTGKYDKRRLAELMCRSTHKTCLERLTHIGMSGKPVGGSASTNTGRRFPGRGSAPGWLEQQRTPSAGTFGRNPGP